MIPSSPAACRSTQADSRPHIVTARPACPSLSILSFSRIKDSTLSDLTAPKMALSTFSAEAAAG